MKTFPLMYQLLPVLWTDIDEARVISSLRHKSKFNLDLF